MNGEFCRTITTLSVIVIAVLMVSAPVSAHEPVFGLGPETLFQDGVGLEYEYEVEEEEDGRREIERHAEILYGLSPRTALTLAGPTDESGDLDIRYKYRFYQNDAPGRQYKAAWIGGLTLPTGSTSRGHGDGSTDFMTSFTAGREATHLYWFADVHARVNGEGDQNLKKGNKYGVFYSIGYRPGTISVRDGIKFQRSIDYYGIDPVFFIETGFDHTSHNERNGNWMADSGGDVAFWAPTAIVTWRNWAMKGGVKYPFHQSLNGDQEELDKEWKVAFEYHTVVDVQNMLDGLFGVDE